MPTPGEKLRAAREARNLSIAQVVKVIRIRSYYIEAMEADDFSSIPSAVQARGFLRSYAEFLGLDMEALLRGDEEAATEKSAIPEAQDPIVNEETETQEEDEEGPPEEEPDDTPEMESEPEVEESPPLEVSQPSDIVFQQIGATLRERRELLGLTLTEIERHTRIRQANLQIIEQGDFNNLPSPVQARGMLKTYGSFLDMDGEAMLLRFADGLQIRRTERQVAPPPPRRRSLVPLWMRNLLSPDLIFGAVLIFSITGLVLWGATRIIAAQEIPEDELQAPSIIEVLLEAPTETPTPDAILQANEEQDEFIPPAAEGQEFPPEEPAPQQQPGSILQVTLLVNERVFLRVIVDDEIRQDGRVAPGAALVFDARERIEVLTGNGNAVQVIYNQIDLGILGNPGQVVNRIYTLDGIQTPTPTLSPTPSNTPRFQPTPTPTLTSTPTITQVP
jgi:cytoskeleton protein RodZ